MKILIVSDCHLPIPAVLGGAVPSLIDSIIQENEAEQKLDIDVVSVFNSKAKERSNRLSHTNIIYINHGGFEVTLDKGVQFLIEKVKPSRKGHKLEAVWKYKVINYLRNILKNNDYDAVVIENHGYLTKTFSDKRLLEKYKGKLYYHLHNELPDSVNEAFGKCCRFILISNYLSKRIVDRYGEEARSRISILKNGIHVESYKQVLDSGARYELRHEMGFSDDDRVVCFVGRITAAKGIMVLLQALEKIDDTSIKLMIVGSTEFGNNVVSEFENKVHTICNELGNRVKATGYVSHEDVWKYYQAADVAVLPSMWEEPAGLTVLEAMASRVPVITTDAGGIPEYIGEKHGLIIKRTNEISGDLTDAIRMVFDNLDDWNERAVKDANYVTSCYSENLYYKNFCEILLEDRVRIYKE